MAIPRIVYEASGPESKVHDEAFQRGVARQLAEADPDIIIGCVNTDEANVWVDEWAAMAAKPRAVSPPTPTVSSGPTSDRTAVGVDGGLRRTPHHPHIPPLRPLTE